MSTFLGQLFGFRWKDWSDYRSCKTKNQPAFTDQRHHEGGRDAHVLQVLQMQRRHAAQVAHGHVELVLGAGQAIVATAGEVSATLALPVIGGFGSLPGAIVGGLVIGVVESLAGVYLPEGFKDIAAYVVVLIMLMVKPNGLFGEKLRKKV